MSLGTLNTILPYTPGSTFTVENAYKKNGIAPANTRNQVQSNEENQADNSLLIFSSQRKI